MSLIIGKAWYNSGEYGDYMTTSINEEIGKLPIRLEEYDLKLSQIPKEKRTKENSPHFNIILSVKDEKKNEEF